ncbi:MAG: SIMPL domain-containing protein [Muribaculaceae bacterium]|nr:SIMPL domain-containing protein [Muribaculaceae bacterium]
MKIKGKIPEAAIIAVGIIVLGFCIKAGIDNFVNKDRVVDVKGLSEMEVPANLVTWPIVTKHMGNDLRDLYNRTNSTNTKILAFLKTNGIKDDEITVNPPEVYDRDANEYASEKAAERYHITSVITVKSTQVDKVREIISRQGELLQDGIAIVSGGYENNIEYEFTSFQDIKPKMMDEAISKAKSTAEQFANKCGSKLGKIITADQGQFSINDRDEHSPHIKSLRVVTTITYQLKD